MLLCYKKDVDSVPCGITLTASATQPKGTMKSYQIHNRNSGLTLGVYEANSEADALDAMARDAGYADYADLCEVAPASEGEIVVREVSE
jgi:hypothetical protein